jgi:SAM-dependent methyltransferase
VSEDPLREWPRTRGHDFLRAYSDALNRELLQRWLPESPVETLLKTDVFDEAAGEGLFPLLQRRASNVFAVDLSPTALAAAGARYPRLDARLGDVRHLPFQDGAFDAVVSNSTLDHFESLHDLRTAVAELARVLRPGGTLIVTLDNAANPLVFLRNHLPYELLRRLRIVQYRMGVTCGPRRLRRLVTDAGFDVQDVVALMHMPRVLALALGSMFPPRAVLSRLRTAEAFARWPTRYVTGQFVGVRAVKR